MTTAGKLAWGVVIAAGILHTDLWAWDDTDLVFGFIPWALAYHAGISLLAAKWPRTRLLISAPPG